MTSRNEDSWMGAGIRILRRRYPSVFSFPGARYSRLVAIGGHPCAEQNDTSLPERENRFDAKFTMVGWWSPWQRTAAFTVKLLKLANVERPNLIILTYVNFAPVASWLRRLYGIPFLAIGHGIGVWDLVDRRVRNALHQADRLFAVSKFTLGRMAGTLGIDQNNIGRLPNTFDPMAFVPTARPRFLLKQYNIAAEQPVILTIARLASAERYKGYDQVLKALPRIHAPFPEVKYVLGGTGPDRPRIERLVQELGLSGQVVLAGYIPDHDLNAHYNLCDVFAMPSKREGSGIVFLESFLARNKIEAIGITTNFA